MHEADGRSRVWVGVLAGVAAALVLLLVAGGAYRAGERDNDDDRAVEQVVVDEDGEPGGDRVVRVVDDDDRDWGPGPGFFLFPLLVILLIVLAFRASRGGGHGWGHRGYGRPYGHGPPWMGPEERAGWLDDWHRRSHGGGDPEARATETTGSVGTSGSGEPEEPTARD